MWPTLPQGPCTKLHFGMIVWDTLDEQMMPYPQIFTRASTNPKFRFDSRNHMSNLLYWESLSLSLLMTRFARILLFFYKGFRGTFVDRFTLLADHLDTLWYWLMLPHVGHTCACCPQGTLHSPNCWLRLSSSGSPP